MMRTNILSRVILSIFILHIIFSTGALKAQNQYNKNLDESLRKISNAYLTKHNLHGLSYCVVLPDNSHIKGSLGKLNNSDNIDETMRWIFNSCTKNVVAAAILHLKEEGKLSLNDPVSDYLTHPNIDCSFTIKELLHHKTNYPEFTGSPMYFKEVVHRPEQIWKAKQVLDKLIKKSSSSCTNFQYCNTNYLVLGLIIEKVTKNNLHDELKTRFFDKLGMQNTTMAPSGYSYSNLAGAWFDTDGDGKLNDLSLIAKEPLNATLSISFASGNIVSTSKDMAIWIKALFDGKIISEKSLEEMKKHALGSSSEGVFKGYGLGLEHVHVHGYNHLGHSGHAIHTSSMFYNPELDIAIVLVLNEPNENVKRQLHMEIFNQVKGFYSDSPNTTK